LCWYTARDAVFLEKQYDLAKKYIPSPLKDYAREKAGYDLKDKCQQLRDSRR